MKRRMFFMAAALAWTAISIAAQTNDDADPNSTWKVTQQVLNNTPYVLERVSRSLTELTKWTKPPAESIAPGTADEHAFTNSAPGHGLVGLVTYGAYDRRKGENVFMGMVIAISAIDCNQPTPVACLSYHRWEGAVCDSNANVRGRWWDNGGSPRDFHTTVQFSTDKSATCLGGIPDAQAALPDERAAAPNELWTVTAGLGNASRYKLRLRYRWNSESTRVPVGPPAEIQPTEISPSWRYENGTVNHGPQALIMYDAFDAARYVGSAVLEAAVDCVTPTPAGCGSAIRWAKAVGRAIPGYTLESTAAGSGPPPDYRVGFEVRGQKNPTAPK